MLKEHVQQQRECEIGNVRIRRRRRMEVKLDGSKAGWKQSGTHLRGMQLIIDMMEEGVGHHRVIR